MAAPYGYPPPPPPTGGGYYPPPPPPSGGYYPPPPPPSGGYYTPPPPPSGGGYYQSPTSYSSGGMPPPPRPPPGHFGGMLAGLADPKVRKERFVRNIFIADIAMSIFSCFMWLIVMALFKWFDSYRLPYALEILLPGALVFLIPILQDSVILAMNGIKKERMVVAWITETSFKIVAELVLLILYYALVAPDVSKYLPEFHVGEYGGREDPTLNFFLWMAGLSAIVVIDVGFSIFGIFIMVRHLRSLRNPNPADGGPST